MKWGLNTMLDTQNPCRVTISLKTTAREKTSYSIKFFHGNPLDCLFELWCDFA
jgi:hypothetical protein